MADITPPDPAASNFKRAAEQAEAKIRAEATGAKETAAGADTTAADVRAAASNVRRARGKVAAAAQELSAEQQALLQEYINAEQTAAANEQSRLTRVNTKYSNQARASDAERVAAARQAAGLPARAPSIGGYGRGPGTTQSFARPTTSGGQPATNVPGIGTPAFDRRLEQAMQSPNFQITAYPGSQQGAQLQKSIERIQGANLGNQKGNLAKGLQNVVEEVQAEVAAVENGEAKKTAAVERGAARRAALSKSQIGALESLAYYEGTGVQNPLPNRRTAESLVKRGLATPGASPGIYHPTDEGLARLAEAQGKSVETIQGAEAKKTTAVEEGAAKREAASNNETKVIGDNADVLAAKAAQIEASVRQASARAVAYNNQAAAGAVPPVESAEFKRNVQQAAAADAQRQVELEQARLRPAPGGPGAGIIPHPELFGRQAYAPLAREQIRPLIQETGDPTLHGRTQLTRAQESLAEAQLQESQASRRLSTLKRNATTSTAAEVAEADRSLASARALTTARRADVAAIEQDISAQLAARSTPGPASAVQAVPTAGRTQLGPIGIPPNVVRQRAADTRTQAAAEEAQAQARVRLAADTQRTAGFEQLLAANTREATLGMQGSSVAMDSNSQAMRRHGALTTEFISQAARGQSSYREWGFQIGATAAKFAGWTAVSIPVFAVMDGIRKIGAGAIDSASGVNTLKRTINDVNAGSAQNAFRDLSTQFNVPIKDAVDAISGMGAVFHHQADAVNAARAALFAYKTGGVDVATATKDLVAIQQGLGASSTDLLDIFDKLNFVQNNYGARIPDLESGVARTAGAFKTAGGSVNELISLLVTLNRQANVTGPQAATIIGRTIGNIRKPSSQAALRGYGIDPTAAIGAVFTQAQTAAQVPGADVRGIAQALGGQYFARQLTPLLLRKSYTDRLRGQLDSGQAAGSSQKELNAVLGQLDEQIKKVGEDLGRLGSNLAESGFLTPLEGLVGLLHEGLTLVNGLLGAFNQLPAPLKDALAVMIEMRGALGVLRRLGVGAGLQDSGRLGRVAPYLVETTDRQAAKLVDSGLQSVTKGARDDAEATTRASLTAAAARRRGAVIAEQDYAVELQRFNKGEITEAELTAKKVEILDRVNALNDKALLAQREAVASTEGLLAVQAEQTALQARLAAAPRSQADAIKRQFAVEQGLPVPGSREVPSAAPVHKFDESGRLVPDAPPSQLGLFSAATAAGTAAERDAETAVAANEGIIRQHARIGETLSNGFKKQVSAFQDLRSKEGTLLAFSGRSTALATTAGAGILTGIKAAGSGITRLGASLAASIGPLGAIIIGATVLEQVVSQFDRNRAAVKAMQDLTAHASQVGTVADYNATRQKLQAETRRKGGFIDNVLGGVRSLGLPVFSEIAGPDRVKQAHETGQQGLQSLPNRNLLVENIAKDTQAAVDRFNAGREGISSLNNQLDQELDRIKSSPASQGAKAGLRSAISSALLSANYGKNFYQTLVGGPSGNLSAITDDVLKSTSDGLNAIIGIGEANHHQIQHFFAQQLAIMGRTRGLSDPTSQQAYAGAYQAIQSAEQALGQQGVADSGRGDASSALRGLLAALSKARSRQSGQAQQLAKRTADDQKQLGVASVLGNAGFAIEVGTLAGLGNQPVITADLGKAQGMRAAIQRAMANSRKQSRALAAALKSITGALDDGAAAISRIEADTALAVAQASTPHGEYLAQQQGLQQELAKTKGHDARTNLQAQIVSGQKAERQRQEQAAQQAAQDAKSRAEAAKQAAEAARQAAADLANARYDYLESLTDNPIKIDRLEVGRASKTLSEARTQTERYQAEAQKNAATRKLREDVTNRRIDNLDFDVEIGKMTQDHEIRALQSILKTTTLGAEFKRGLRQKILRLKHDLESETNLDQLNVGNIKLPTVYDVRRLAQQGTHSAPVQVNHTSNITVNGADDPELTGAAIERHVTTSIRAGLRSAGAR